ncbi:MAG: type II toxin-antitoxin system BrnA family antitoxin [Candidatus Rifleibacteriota bacterium]
MKAKNFDKKFENGESILENLDLKNARRSSRDSKRVNVDFPKWMIEALDREAKRLNVTRQSVIKIWLAERLEKQTQAA